MQIPPITKDPHHIHLFFNKFNGKKSSSPIIRSKSMDSDSSNSNVLGRFSRALPPVTAPGSSSSTHSSPLGYASNTKKTHRVKRKNGGGGRHEYVPDAGRGGGSSSGHGARVSSPVSGALPIQPISSALRCLGATSTGARGAIIGSRATASNRTGAPKTGLSSKRPVSHVSRASSMSGSSAHHAALSSGTIYAADTASSWESSSDERVSTRPYGGPMRSGPVKVRSTHRPACSDPNIRAYLIARPLPPLSDEQLHHPYVDEDTHA